MKKNVAIIGSSTAGLLTAKILSENNTEVKVYEANKEIDPSPRTLIVTSRMRNLIGPLCDDAVINSIDRFELFANGRVGTVLLDQPDLIIERSKLTKGLLEEVESNGVEILTSNRFLDLNPNGKSLNFHVSANGNGAKVENSADVVVGADGAFSSVAKRAGWPEQKTVPLAQAVVELPEDMTSNTARVWFLPDETPFFYWLIPHSKTHGVLGLIGVDESETRMLLENFLDRKKIYPIEFQSSKIPLYTEWVNNHKRLGNNDVYLVGDAAGHVKVSTVGGIVTGFRGAIGVAEAILNGSKSSKLKELRRELNFHNYIRMILNRFTQEDYVKLIDLLNPSAKKSLGRFTRDETPKLLFNLLRKQPRLLLLSIKAFLTK